jgi:uncharacterized membrane protein (UPF0127 family)
MAAPGVLVVLGVLALVSVACGSSSPSTSATTTTSVAADATTTSLVGLARARAPFADFEQMAVTIRTADGRTRTPCMLVARTDATRDRGLMGVTDPALAGYAGMVFVFDTDATGTFWMKDTRIPLTVFFFNRRGLRVSADDMVPCPSDSTQCPLYPATAPYRWAIEVPAGRDTLGLLDGQPFVTLGGACPH